MWISSFFERRLTRHTLHEVNWIEGSDKHMKGTTVRKVYIARPSMNSWRCIGPNPSGQRREALTSTKAKTMRRPDSCQWHHDHHAHRFFDGSVVVKTMAYWKCAVSESSENDKYTKQRTLQDVDVVELQTLQAFLDCVKYVLPGQTMLVNIAKPVGISNMRNLFPWCTGNSIIDL